MIEPATTPAADERQKRRALWITCAVHFVHDGIADAIYVLLPIWAQAFGLSYAQVGVLRTAYSTALAFLQMPAGMLGRAHGGAGAARCRLVLAGLAFALLAVSQSHAALGALILLAGVGSAVQHPLASTIISRAYTVASRRAALGVYNFAGDVGKMVVAAAMGLGAIAHRLAEQRHRLRCDRCGRRRCGSLRLERADSAGAGSEGSIRSGRQWRLGLHQSHRLRPARQHPGHRQRLPHRHADLPAIPVDRQGGNRRQHRLRPVARVHRRRRR